MNAFRQAPSEVVETVKATFPMLWEEDWSDSPLLTYSAISIWDHWLYETGQEGKLDICSIEEYQDRCSKFRRLNRFITAGTKLLNATYHEDWQFGEPNEIDRVLKRIDPETEEGGFVLLLPELRVIYTSGDGDHHTRVIWHQGKEHAMPLERWVRDAGLKFVGKTGL